MANVKVARAYDSMYGAGNHAFSVIATDKWVEYVFPDGAPLFDADKQVDRLLSFVGDRKPTTSADWIRLGTSNFGTYTFSIVDMGETSLKEVVSAEKERLDKQIVSYENYKVSDQNIEKVVTDFYAKYPDGEAPESAMMKYLADLIDAAGTRDLNPWLDEWLETGEYDEEDFDGIILDRG